MKGFCLSCAENGPFTGRLGYHADDFLDINGYDEKGPPSSGQDVDIRKRMESLAKQKGLDPKLTHVWLYTKEICGVALPNDFENTTTVHDRGYSKVVNCDPVLLATLNTEQDNLWNAMKINGQQYWKKLWQHSVIRRNLDVSKEKAGLGSWWALTARSLTRPENMFLSCPANVPSAAASQGDVDMPPVGLELQSGRQVPQRAQSMECCEKAITVEVLTIGAAELKWKFDTSISSLGRRSEHAIVCSWVLSSCLAHFVSHHRSFYVPVPVPVTVTVGAGTNSPWPWTTVSPTLRTCCARPWWKASLCLTLQAALPQRLCVSTAVRCRSHVTNHYETT